MEAQSPSSEVAGRRSAPVRTMGAGAAQRAGTAKSAIAMVVRTSPRAIRAGVRGERNFMAEPRRFGFGGEQSPHFNLGVHLLRAYWPFYRFAGWTCILRLRCSWDSRRIQGPSARKENRKWSGDFTLCAMSNRRFQ